MTVKLLGHVDDLEGGNAPDCECSSERCHGNHHCSGEGVVVARNVHTNRRSYLCQRCAGKAESPFARDMPGMKNPARRAKAARAKVGRRKTVKTKAGRLVSRRSRKAVKRALFRENSKAKRLACHACARNDFASEKSLKAHTAKFHTPGQKSPRGFRTARDRQGSRTKYVVLYRHTFKDTGGDDWDFKRFRDKGVALKFVRRIRKNGGEAKLTTGKVTASDLRSHKKVYSGERVHWGTRKTPYQPYYDGEHMTRVNSAERRRGRRWKKRMDHATKKYGSHHRPGYGPMWIPEYKD